MKDIYSVIFMKILSCILHNDRRAVYETIRSGRFKVVTVQGNQEP